MTVERRTIGDLPLIGRADELKRIVDASCTYGGMTVKAQRPVSAEPGR